MTADEISFMLATTATATCCREWEVSPYAHIGRCGYCGEYPAID